MAVDKSTTKRCGKCGEYKPLDQFYASKKKCGRGSRCKICSREFAAAWRAANPEKAKTSIAEYREKNKDKIRAEKIAWAAANRDRMLKLKSAWNKANAEKRRLYEHNRRARQSGEKLSPCLGDKLFKLQRGKCACGCKQPLGTDYHLDHIMPLALGGSNTDDNIQLLRATCNQQKYAKHPVDFMQSRGFLL